MYDETVRQSDASGKNFCKVLSDKGVLPGIKLDKGAVPIMGTDGETATQGLDGLTERCKEYYGMGCRFAKWRGILKIGDGQPTQNAVLENTWSLARYASICQMNGLVPIVEPEILADGKHTIETCQAVWERVWSVQIKALIDQNVMLEGILLKPNMVTSGLDCPQRAEDTVEKVAAATQEAIQRRIPPAIPGILFLSGGQSEVDATKHLNAMNKLDGRPWALSFSYGRALQNSCVKTWAGKAENVAKAQEALIIRAQANSEATVGKYEKDSKDIAGANEGLIVKNYVY